MLSLETEFLLYAGERAEAWLRKNNCPEISIGWAASADIMTSSMTWKPVRDNSTLTGKPVHAMIVPVEYINFDDLVAWVPADPSTWWLRNGKGEILGRGNLERAEMYGEPIKVHSTPCAWLMGGMEGCCPLTAGSYRLFMGAVGIDAEQAVYDKIIKQLQKCYPMPPQMAVESENRDIRLSDVAQASQ